MRFLDAKQAPGAPSNKMAPGAPANKQRGGVVRISPAAQALAEKEGVDVSTLRGRGQGGSITVADVREAAARNQRPAPGTETTPPAPEGGELDEVPGRSPEELPVADPEDGLPSALPGETAAQPVVAPAEQEPPRAPGRLAVSRDEHAASDVVGRPLIGESVNHSEPKK